MVFGQNNPDLTSNKHHIWSQHKKLSRSICVSNCFCAFFFGQIFIPGPPQEYVKKMNLVKKLFGLCESSPRLIKCHKRAKRPIDGQ